MEIQSGECRRCLQGATTRPAESQARFSGCWSLWEFDVIASPVLESYEKIHDLFVVFTMSSRLGSWQTGQTSFARNMYPCDFVGLGVVTGHPCHTRLCEMLPLLILQPSHEQLGSLWSVFIQLCLQLIGFSNGNHSFQFSTANWNCKKASVFVHSGFC